LQIKNNRLYATPPDHVFQSRERTILLQLVHLLQKYDLPDIDVMLVTDDFCPDKDIPHRSFDGNYKRCSRLVRNPAPLKQAYWYDTHADHYGSLLGTNFFV
jgi:hypothetical protein